jgi:ribosome-associated toxin RatA of RatAB toxin-antitoxin module
MTQMKELRGTASAVVSASREQSFRLLAAVDRYPSWNAGMFREVEVLELDGHGQPKRARARMHIALSPLHREFELEVAVRTDWPHAVYLTRIPYEPSDQERMELAWRLADDGPTRIELGFEAAISVLPRFLPLPRVGDLIAQSMLASAATTLGAT